MQGVVVFLGPSLDHGTAKTILDAEYLPPAKRGDITRAIESGAVLIGLIDGVFYQDSAVGHREILAALTHGIRVVGASSMGALRAAEMDVFGMEGIGEVYRLYADGILESDDEVALVFDPYTSAPLSEPLVNIRFALRLALEAGILTREEHDAILKAASELYYPDRTYRRIVADAAPMIGHEAGERFLEYMRLERPDLKRNDAIAALNYIKESINRSTET